MFYRIENLAFCAEFSSFAQSLTPLFYFHKNHCRNSSYSCESLWWTCSTETTRRDWFRRFKSGDFNLSNKDRGKPPKKFEDAELQALLDEDSTRTLKKLATALGVDQGTIFRLLHTIRMIQEEGKLVPYELKERDIERRKTTCEILLDRFKRVIFASHCYWRWKVDVFRQS